MAPPSEKSVMTASSETVPVHPVHTLLEQAARRHPDLPAVDFLGKRYSYGEIGDLTRRAARGFQLLGVRKGTRVGLCLPNTPYFVICYYAILMAGGVVVNFNPLYVERELKHQVDDSGVSIMVTLDLKQIYPKVAALLEESCLERIVTCPMSAILPSVKSLLFSVVKRSELADIPDDLAHVPFARLIDNDGRVRSAEIEPSRDLAVLQYTGGTTGVPKGAMLTHANLVANTEQLWRWMPPQAGDRGQDRMLGVLPLFHVFAMTVVMNLGVRMGAELILVPRFELKQVLKLIARKRPTLFPGVPTIYTAINQAVGESGQDLSSIRICISGGAPLPVEVRSRFEALTGCSLVEGYGLSESSPVATCNPIGGVAKNASIGLPLDWTAIEIRDPVSGALVESVGERGEICVRGPQVMAGYWKRPDDTSAVMIDGALRTGDIGYRDEDGYIFLVDRIKDVILCGGFNVYPRVLEEALYQHPAVAEAVVIGIPDPYRGQAPKAFVRLKDGASASPDELKAYLATQVSRIEMPKAVEIRDQLPKTMIGKLSKKELVAEETAAAETTAHGAS